jgi:hypothetical protein
VLVSAVVALFSSQSAQREFGPKIAPLKTHFLDLIRLEFAVEEEKIGATMPTLTAPPNPDKPKLLDQRVKASLTRQGCLQFANHVTQAFALGLPWMRGSLTSFGMTSVEVERCHHVILTFVTFLTL